MVKKYTANIIVKNKNNLDLFEVKTSKWNKVKVILLVNKIVLLNKGTLKGLKESQEFSHLKATSGFGQKLLLNINQKKLKNNITSLKTNNKNLYLKQSVLVVLCWARLVSLATSINQNNTLKINKKISVDKGVNAQQNQIPTPIKFINKPKHRREGNIFGLI